jgi:hypothetical protein
MADTFEGWAIVELMGHRRLAGYVTEEDHFGTAMLRLDIRGADDTAPAITQLYGGSSVYCLTPTTEDIARKLGERLRPAPVSRYELEPPPRREADPWAADGPVEAVVHAYDCAGGDCVGDCFDG